MRWKSLAVLAIIFAVLAGFYYVYEIRLAPEREKKEGAKGRLWTVEPKDVEEVILRREADTVHLKREGDGWALVEPLKARGDRGPANDVVTNLVTARVDREIEAQPGNLADFGLAPPTVEITVTVKARPEPLVLLLGGKNPTGVWVYAKEKSKPAVFALSELTLRDATRPVSDFRDKTIVAFTRQEVTQLEIGHRDQSFTVERGEGPAQWRLVKPRAYRADSDRLSDFLDKLQLAKVKEFTAEAPKSLAPYGLDRPTRITLWTGKETDRAAKTVLLGRIDAGKKGVYAMRSGESSVFLLPEDVWSALPKTLAELRDKTVLAYDRDKVSKVEIESPKGKVVLAKEGERWQISEPGPLKADDAEVGALLWKLRDVKAQSFVTEDRQGAGRYLSRPQVKVSVWEQGAQAPRTLVLAPAPEKRDGKALAYAGIAGEGPVVLVDSSALQELAKSVTELREHSLLGFFDPKDVKRMQVKIGEQGLLVERTGETEWRLVEPKKGKPRDTRLTDLVFALRGLRWKELVSSRAEDAARYGLDRPTLEVTLWKADGGEIGTVLVGGKDGGRTYLKTKASPELYAIESRQLGDLPKSADDLLS